MRNKLTKSTPLFYTCLLMFFGLTSVDKCADQAHYSTQKLRKAQQEIQEHMTYLISVRDTIKQTKCPEILQLDTFILRKELLFSTINTWDFDSLDIPKAWQARFNRIKALTLDANGMIMKDSIPLPTKGYSNFIKSNLDQLEHELRAFNNDLKVYRSRIKKCVRRYNRCKDLLVSGSNQNRVKIVKHALRYYTMPDESFENNRVAIEAFAEANDNYLGKEVDKSEIIALFHLATVYYVRYRLSGNSEDCNKSHIRWSALEAIYRFNSNDCEIIYLEKESRAGWPVKIDSAWVAKQKEVTRDCATHPRGCNCPSAINYDSLAVTNDKTCIACNDPLALNYCPNTKYEAPCIYLLCADSCFKESYAEKMFPKFKRGRDQLRFDPKLCLTDICGCTEVKCDSYEATAEIDDGSCDCGCLDPNASNYARRPGKYYNPKVKTHQQELCHNRGCMSECAENYDPYANEPDGSCECKAETKVSLQQKINMVSGKLAMDVPTTEDLELSFLGRFNNAQNETKRAARKFKFIRKGNDLTVEGASRVDKIKSKGYVDDIPTGVYNFPAMNEVVSNLMNFLDEETGGQLLQDRITGKVVGEADGQRINSGGIPFENARQDIANAPFREIPLTVDTDIDAIAEETFDLSPDRMIVSLPDGGMIKNNTELAFVRGHRIKTIILTILGADYEDRILVGAKANTGTGGRFRKISLVITIEDFFLDDGKTKEQLAFELERLKAAKKVYDVKGYPSPGPRKYVECPCYSL